MKQLTLAMAADRCAECGAQLRAVVETFYPKRGNGRPPIALERMSRIMNWHARLYSCYDRSRRFAHVVVATSGIDRP